ncbi:DUF308 domain-containing protein [Bradyrhizobium sp. LHD-71]|uniref:HdeD family acid-resistance protein n=1 Tax=Bradyrhizobium sp. LHD-71 TaxID=3072141 RepID=UPI00280D1EB6|nr:DUF308 domain-containing protein [Bradyrhizobium sp. LHD-71]MDQ8730525.1 DUF308 domain-containing protein [Bradyrhizobium sp. LHD-71]
MTATDPVPVPSMSRVLSDSGIRWGWLLALGILITVLGILGLGMTYWLTIVAVFWFGALVIVAGAAQLIDAFHHKEWRSLALHAIIGLVYVLAGLVMVAMPVFSAFWLTIFLAASLLVAGIFRSVIAFQVREAGPLWITILISGLISVVLGFMIFGTLSHPSAEALTTPAGQAEWIRGWGWIIGLFVAIELIMEGVSLILLSLAAKPAKPETPAGAIAAH